MTIPTEAEFFDKKNTVAHRTGTHLADDFAEGWKHYLNCINFGTSHLDAEAIRFMNEMPSKVIKALAK